MKPKVTFTPNPNFERDLQKMVQKHIDEHVQPAADAELRRVVGEVRDKMSGQPADEVYVELVRRLEDTIPGFEPNEPNLREVAANIEAGTLRD